MQSEQMNKRQKVVDTSTTPSIECAAGTQKDAGDAPVEEASTAAADAPPAVQAVAAVAPARPRGPKKHIQLLDGFNMSQAHLQPLVKSTKCNLVPLVYAYDKKSPVLIQLNGGGVIPKAFGVDDKETDGRRKVQVAFQIDSLSDHEHLERLRVELGEMVASNWQSWYPDVTCPSKEVLMNFCNGFVSPRKKKKNSDDKWSGVSKAAVDPDECMNGKCKILDRDSGCIIPLDELAGRTWHKIILELRYVYIQATKSYGITKKLRYLSCSPMDEDGEIEPL
jgi:hypothetical protein